MIRTVPKLNVNHIHFGSVAAAIDAAAVAPKRAANVEQWNSQNSRVEGPSWYGIGAKSHSDAMAIVESCDYKHGVGIIDALYDRMAAKLPMALDLKRHRVRREYGDELDVHAVFRGDLSRAWETMTKSLRRGRGAVRIVADICGNAGESADALQWRGVAALALDRILRRAGYSVEIVAAIGTTNSGQRDRGQHWLSSITVKPRHAISHAGTLAATVAFPGFFRALGFQLIVANCEQHGVDVSGGLGQASAAQSMLAPDPLNLQVVTPTIANERSVEEWLRKTVKFLEQSTVAAA